MEQDKGENLEDAYNVCKDLISEASHVILSVGAGLSASAGVNYSSTEVFEQFFPDMAKRGYRCMYQFIGHSEWSDELKWGYLCRQVNEVRFKNDMVINNTYDLLKQLVPEPTMIITSNVDGLLHRNGHYDAQLVCETQGSYSIMQCLAKCKEDAYWPSKPEIDRLMKGLNSDGTTSAAPPTCPNCGSPCFLQVRGGEWFNEHPQKKQREQYKKLIKEIEEDPKSKLVIVEIGVGFNTAVVLRLPNEALCRSMKDRATLVRINRDYPQTPANMCSLQIRADAFDFLNTPNK